MSQQSLVRDSAAAGPRRRKSASLAVFALGASAAALSLPAIAAPGDPVVAGGVMSVGVDSIAGLPTNLAVTADLPDGDAVDTVVWKSSRPDCSFSAPTNLSTTVACDAGKSTPTTVTATVTSEGGIVLGLSREVSFASATGRAVDVALVAANQTGATPVACLGAPTAVTAVVTDDLTGLPIKGAKVTLTKKATGASAASTAGTPLTDIAGKGSITDSPKVATQYKASSAPVGAFAAGAVQTVDASVVKCTPDLSASISGSTTWYGDPLTVSGNATRAVGGSPVNIEGLPVQVTLTAAGKTTVLATAKTNAAGGFSVAVKPLVSGTVAAKVADSASYAADSVGLGSVTVNVPATDLDAVAPVTPDVAYGQNITVTGTLSSDRSGVLTGLGGRSVSLVVTDAGKATVIGSAKTAANGTFSATVPLKVSGTLAAKFAAMPGQPAATADLGAVTAGNWDTAVTATASTATTITAGGTVTLTGSASRSFDGGASEAIKASGLGVYFKATGATAWTKIATAKTGNNGSYTVKAVPKATGALKVSVVGIAGHANSDSAEIGVTVSAGAKKK